MGKTDVSVDKIIDPEIPTLSSSRDFYQRGAVHFFGGDTSARTSNLGRTRVVAHAFRPCPRIDTTWLAQISRGIAFSSPNPNRVQSPFVDHET
tara:strand:+ start:10299 stop:10577 length:279 start_codon:yes stop_codon:yes gene_type:complete